MTRVKVSSKLQIAVPAAARKKLGIEAGDHLIVEIGDDSITFRPEPKSYSERLRGLYREIWEGVDPDEYIRKERDAWTE
ncbi:MAG TPA: AbrB/MazE/SpoVT family DNA-binding domain-containing protein [Nitrolancea sp.]|nr:AbrB/MazE/SpoVT family DNA-binding domain-containing protein [Nitrolancea sp.]